MNKLFETLKRKDVGAIGIGAMIVFIAMVLVAGIAASVLVQTANKLEIQAMQTGDQTRAEVATGIRICDIEGHYSTRYMPYNRTGGLWWNATRNDGSQGISASSGHGRSWYNYSRLHNLTITIAPRAGSSDLDLSETVVEISNSTVKCILKYIGPSTNPNFAAAVATGGVFATTDSVNMFDQRANSFGVIELEDADGSCSATNPVINRGDKVMICINLSACFWGLPTRTDVWGQVIPEQGSSGLFSFRTPASYSNTVYDLY